MFDRLPPGFHEMEAAGLFERFRGIVAKIAPDKVGEVDAYKPMLIQAFKFKLSQGWVPKKGYTTEAVTRGSMNLFRDYKLGKWTPGSPVDSYFPG